MARLEIPARTFIEDFCLRAFPNRDFSRGSALSDLVIKPFAALMQPYRHELDVIKVNQSVLNYQYMTTDAMDAMAANQAYFRQTGAQSFGDVTMYFDTATDYAFNYLEFVSDDNVTFLLTAPVTITAAALLRNKQADGSYAATVSVRSVGVGNRYQLAAGRINTLRNRPSGVIRVTNLTDFAVTAPDETNFDIVNGMFRNLGLRNLVSRQSIRGPIYDQFPGILDIFVAGANHPKMVRDLVQISESLSAHVGGMIDVWVNTSNVSERTCTISYLPADARLRLVSAAQAASDAAAFTFANGALSFEGLFTPDSIQGVLDESMGFVFSENGIASEAFVAYRTTAGAALLAKTMRTAGEAIVLPSPWRTTSSLIVDPTGASMASAGAKKGDTVRLGTDVRSISSVVGRVLGLTPTVNKALAETQTTASAATGALEIFVQNASGVLPGDSVLISECPGAGWYRIYQAVSSSDLLIGNLISRGTIALSGPSDNAGFSLWTYTGEVPADIVVMPWIFQDPAALTGTPERVTGIFRGVGVVYLELPDAASFTGSVALVGGLRGSVPAGVSAVVSGIGDPGILSSSVMSAAKSHTLYTAETIADLAIGTTTLPAVGLLQTDVRAGDIIVWDLSAGSITPELMAASGGDGSVYTSMVATVIDSQVTFVPPLPLEIPTNTAWSILRNGLRQSATFGLPNAAASSLYATTKASASGNNITLAGWTRGLGDGSGLGVVGYDTQALTINSVAEPKATFADASKLKPGDIISQATNYWDVLDVTGNVVTVVLSRDFVSGAPATFLAAGSCTVSRIRARVVVSSQLGSTTTLFFAAPRQAYTITFSATNYASPSPADINRVVKQTIGANTYTGTLAAYDPTNRTWTVVPNDVGTDVFGIWTTPGEEVTIIGGGGSGRSTLVSALGNTGYVPPLVGDINAKVRQGPYTGTLVAYGSSEWYVRPDAASDLFDRTDIPTYVDRSNDVAQDTTEPYGYLRAPADAPQFGAAVSGPVTLTLDAPSDFADGAAMLIYSRFSRLGALGAGSTLSVAPISGLNDTPFSSVVPGDVRVTIPVGSATGPYDVGSVPDAVTYTKLGLTSSAPTAVSIPYGHEEKTILGATISSGATSVTLPTTTIGLFGHQGRALRVKILSDVYYLPISSAGVTNDSVNLAVGFPVAVTPSTQITVAVVDAYITPFFASTIANLVNYHITEPPSVATQTPVIGTAGVISGVGTLSDSSVQFAAALNGSLGLRLHLDAGANASLDPYPITTITSNSVNFTADFVTPESFVPYHVTYRAPVSYTSYIGYVDGSTLRIPAGTDELTNFGSVRLRLTPLFTTAAAETRTVTAITSTTATLSSASALPNGTAVTVNIIRMDRTATNSVPGTVLFTYNYYANDFMDLPVVRMLSVEQLDPDTLAPLRSLEFTVTPVRSGYRYSAQEVNDLVILDATAVGAPLRLTYSTDPTIAQIDSYLTEEDTKNQCAGTLAKRMETIVIDLTVTVRSDRTSSDLQDLISQYVTSLTSREPVSKDGIIKYLYDQQVASMIDVSSFTLSGTYHQEDGTVTPYTNVASIYGAETAAYLPGAITVYKVNA